MSDEPRPEQTVSGERRPELSAIVLGYRAGESLRKIVDRLEAELEGSGVEFEMVLVGNYSDPRDPTPEVARELDEAYAPVHAVVVEKGGGMGWDMRTGFERARGEILIVMDGDAQNPTGDVLRMYTEMRRTGADLMKGKRIERFDGFFRRFQTFVYNVAFRVLFRTKGLWDINGKPKGLTRRAYETVLPLESDDWFMDAEIIIKAHRAGLELKELPVVFLENEERASFVKASAVWEFIVNMARFRFR